MWPAEFARIANEYPAHQHGLAELENHLSLQSLGVPLSPDRIADFVGLSPHFIEEMLQEFAEKGLMGKQQFGVCPECNVPIESDAAAGRRECDLCEKTYPDAALSFTYFYHLKQHVLLRTSAAAVSNGSQIMENPLANNASQTRFRIEPWATLPEEAFTISVATLHEGPRRQALDYLEKFGIVRLRWQGDPPTVGRIASLEQWIGPARTEQNDFRGKVHELHPRPGVAANTGSSMHKLAPHVDGTQDEITPAFLVFQYDHSATWGGESTFYDMAALLGALPGDVLVRLLTSLSRAKSATCTKVKENWSKTYIGPLFRAENDGHTLSLRFRGDDLLKVIPECEADFKILKDAIETWTNQHALRYTPQEGDLVVFDNWRLLHGREEVGGRHQRIHDRMWIDNLLPALQGRFHSGIRPLPPDLMALVMRSNAG